MTHGLANIKFKSTCETKMTRAYSFSISAFNLFTDSEKKSTSP